MILHIYGLGNSSGNLAKFAAMRRASAVPSVTA
jgi:hypothetical protein